MNRVTREATSTHPDVSMQEVVSVKCPKAQKEYFTVIKNVRKGHQIQDDGEFQVRPLKFFDQMGHQTKPYMHLWKISISSLDNDIFRPTKVMNRADKNWAHF